MQKVSVIVPCYKRISQTVKTIGLIFNSKNFEGEVIAVDSTRDNSLKKALFKKFKNKDFSYLKPKKIGISINKNRGAKKAKHTILIFCDSDIEIEKDTILKTIKALKKQKKAAALTGRVFWKTKKTLDRPRKEDRMIKKGNTVFVENIFSRYMATYKDVFLKVGGYDEKAFNMRGEGADLSVRYWRNGWPLVFEKSIKVYHVHEAKESIALRVKHPEWLIAKDRLLLALKYDSLDSEDNFAETMNMIFSKFKKQGYFRVLQGIGKNIDFICKNKNIKAKKAEYDFKFFEVFSKKPLLEKALSRAEKKLKPWKS